jgi:hypothetical protein
MLQKNAQDQRPTGYSDDRLDHLAHAVAFVILRRQMRGKWLSPRPTARPSME